MAHVQDLSMQRKITTFGTCNAVKTEAINGGAVENEPSVYSWVSQWRRRDVDASTSAALLVAELDIHLTAWETVKVDSIPWHLFL